MLSILTHSLCYSYDSTDSSVTAQWHPCIQHLQAKRQTRIGRHRIRKGRTTEKYSAMTTPGFDRFFKASAAWHFNGSSIWNTDMFLQLTCLWDHEWSWICNQAASITVKYLEKFWRRKPCSFVYFLVFHNVRVSVSARSCNMHALILVEAKHSSHLIGRLSFKR